MPGIGGQWLKKVILNIPTSGIKGHFHDNVARTTETKSFNKLFTGHMHKEFDYLYYGEYWFNFYLNQVYKHLHLRMNIFSTQSYEKCFLQCVTEAHMIEFRSLADRAFFKFEDLLCNPEKFLWCVHQLQGQLQVEKISQESFFNSRKHYFSTCVDVNDSYNNTDNIFYICYALGELKCVGFTPTHFLINDPTNREKCLEYIHQHRKYLMSDIPVYHFNSAVTMPNFTTT